MTNKKQKLELTWIGKDEELKLEPRILIEDSNKSYGDKSAENMLIHGDNLLALKALEQDFAGRIKCIYIDPPYNTGSRIDSDGKEIGYEDGLEHSEWLNLMKPRLEILKKLLHPNGTLAAQIDDNEFARLYLLMTEIFQEKNLKTICVKMSEPTGVKMAHAINNGRIPKLKEFIIIARKDGIKDLFVEKVPKEKWDNEYKTLFENISKSEIGRLKEVRDNEERSVAEIEECDRILSKITTKPISECYREQQIADEKKKVEFNFENAWRIVQVVSMSGGAKTIADVKRKNNRNPFFAIETPQKKMYFIRNEYDSEVEIPRIKVIFADDYLTVHPGDFWGDIKTTGLDNEGGVKFKKGKKPEALIKRIIGMTSDEGELVLDSFAGSGTTGAVAHKMKRKWIMVEMATHVDSHLIPRIKSVIDGSDTQGISETVNWLGGGGFKFYNLAPSLLRKDSFGNFVIDENYNANMLAAAMCKHEGFKFYPDETLYWKHGKSTETDFIFVTTGFITAEQLDKVHSEMKAGESLLICAKAYAPECENHFANITIKKIPQMILGRCEFGKDNYDLNIIKATEAEAEESNEE